MTVTAIGGNESLKERLATMSKPTNEILARLQNQIFGNPQKDASADSRMHNRHNRS